MFWRAPGVTGAQVVERPASLRLEGEDHRRIAEHATRRTPPSLRNAPGDVAGYARGGDIELVDDAVSKIHAALFGDDAGRFLVDVDSKNGAWLNGDRVFEAVLLVGDLVRVGEPRLQVRLPDQGG
ncbi:MAG: FHA domain-containing protein [Deltaproteobacteria bacterium]|nr:FHA domain-containing protein [Deltaproteobacteria bacterium]